MVEARILNHRGTEFTETVTRRCATSVLSVTLCFENCGDRQEVRR